MLQNSLENRLVHVTENYLDGRNLLEAVAERGWKGSRQEKGSPYIPGPRKSSYWIKTNCNKHWKPWWEGSAEREKACFLTSGDG